MPNKKTVNNVMFVESMLEQDTENSISECNSEQKKDLKAKVRYYLVIYVCKPIKHGANKCCYTTRQAKRIVLICFPPHQHLAGGENYCYHGNSQEIDSLSSVESKRCALCCLLIRVQTRHIGFHPLCPPRGSGACRPVCLLRRHNHT